MNIRDININTDIKDLESIDKILGDTISYFSTPDESKLIEEALMFKLEQKRRFVKTIIAKKLIEIPNTPIKTTTNGTFNN